jgi:hypothetical protein
MQAAFDRSAHRLLISFVDVIPFYPLDSLLFSLGPTSSKTIEQLKTCILFLDISQLSSFQRALQTEALRTLSMGLSSSPSPFMGNVAKLELFPPFCPNSLNAFSHNPNLVGPPDSIQRTPILLWLTTTILPCPSFSLLCSNDSTSSSTNLQAPLHRPFRPHLSCPLQGRSTSSASSFPSPVRRVVSFPST